MDKPSTVIREEFIESLAKLLNESGLPAFVLADVLNNALNATRELAEKQYRADAAAWAAEQKKAEKQGGEKCT